MDKYLKFLRLFLVLMVGVFFLVGSCVSGDCDEETKTGYLIDSAVANITYECGTKIAKTDNTGKFECSESPITFKVGNVEVGTLDSITDDSKVYPQDLMGVSRDNFDDVNMIKVLVFLQSLDDDGDISQAIMLPNDVNSTLNKKLSEMTFDEIVYLIESLGKTAVSQEDAINHLKEQFNIDTTKPVITLNGINPLSLIQGTAYTEAGATATDDRDGTVSVTTSGTVDVNTVGSYTITYKAKDSAGNEATIIRTVNVVLAPDTTKPVITLEGNNLISLIQGIVYSDAGATATDDRDGNLTVTVTGSVDINRIGSYILTYSAKDSAGNEATITRTVNVVLAPDTTSPVITLNGDSSIELIQGTDYSEVGAIATDDRDGNLTVTVTGSVDVSTIGSYTLTYSVRDSAGNETTLTRTIDVVLQMGSITGYVEDDAMPNAIIRITDSTDNLIVETISDNNGKYEVEAPFKEDEIYTLESAGTLGDRNITLHSIFKFSADTVINTNPITELKYQLVQSGKSLEDAEALIRDYFEIIVGEKLESNRFSTDSSLAIGLRGLAKLYDKTLPIDVITKIKEDILNNDTLDDGEYAYRDLLQNKLELTVSSDSLEVGNSVTITLVGAENLNDSYLLEWVGLPSDYSDDGMIKTFTSIEAGDTIVSVNLYKKDSQDSSKKIFLSNESAKINFYIINDSKSIVVNGSDMNETLASDVRVNISANALGVGEQISYSEIITNSNDYIKVFNLEPSGTVFSTPMEIRVKFNPTMVSDPRKLTIKRISNDGVEDILKIKEVDYINSELVFETEHFSKFLIGSDVKYTFKDTSFEVWNEKGVKEKKIKYFDSNDLLVQKHSPYDYLVESLYLYCITKKIDTNTCKGWVSHFINEEKATEIDTSYKEFFDKENNYDIFTNNYFIWYLIKTLPTYPGDVSNSTYDTSSIARENYDKILECMHSATLGQNMRELTISTLLKGASAVEKIANALELEKLGSVLAVVNEYAPVVSQLYKDYTNDSDFRTNRFLISMTLGKFVVEKILSHETIPLGGIYFTLLEQSVDLLTKGFNGDDFIDAATSTNVGFPKYFAILISEAEEGNINKHPGFEVRKMENQALGLYDLKNSKFVTGDEANKYLGRILLWNGEVDAGRAKANLLNFYITLNQYFQIYYMKDYRDQLYKNLKLEGLKVALGILEIAKKVTTSDLVSKKQAKISLQDIKQYNINQQQKIQKSIAQKTTTSSVEFTTIPVLDNFDNFLTQIKINIPETLWSSIVIKKVSLDVDKYAIDESPSTDTTQKTFEATSFVDNSIFNNSNLSKNGFVLANEKYTQDLATIFSGIDSSKFQDSLVVVNLKILLSINGIDKVASKEYQFINYLDSEDELLNEFGYGKMIGVITDVNTSEPIADAMVNISSQATSYYTDANGNYNISLLPPATYSIRVSKDGYADTAQECIVEVNQTTECSIGIIEQNISTPFVASGVIKKTGQTISYTDYDDGYYQKGVSHSYTRDDNKEIVTDHITGLEWQDDSEAKTVTKQWLTTANYYAENYDDTSGDTATTYCSNLTLGGYNDWRLPTVQELLFIVDNSKYNPSIDSHFQNITSNDYWSSTDTSYTYDALYVNFHSGNTGYFKGFGLHICCVRAGE